jgi:hypothetical protein
MRQRVSEIDEREVLRLYKDEDLTLREVARRLKTSHHRIRRILGIHGVGVTRKNKLRVFTEEHRRKIGQASKGRRPWSMGLKMSEESKRKNMRAKLKTEIDLSRYPDFERLKLLTRLTARHRAHLGLSDEARRAFLDRFYFDEQFNRVYDAWLASGKSKWFHPSLDHIDPKANGGTFDLSNLRFITWFENRAKADMTLEQWERFKAATNTCSDLFV